MEEEIIFEKSYTDKLRSMMKSKKYFKKIKINDNLYKYECDIDTKNKINIYTNNNYLYVSHINDEKFLRLFFDCINLKCTNDDELIDIYDDLFNLNYIPKKINIAFGELIKKYIKYDINEIEKTNSDISKVIEKFITCITHFDRKITKISSRYELYHDNILFNMCLGSITENKYVVEIIIFGKTIMSLINI